MFVLVPIHLNYICADNILSQIQDTKFKKKAVMAVTTVFNRSVMFREVVLGHD